MQFLADESCDILVVKLLRQAGYDVKAIAEISPRTDDRDVVKLATSEHRILITEDKDFGQLVFAYGRNVIGVILIRYPAHARKLLQGIANIISKHEKQLVGNFIVVQPGKVRISKI